MIPWSFFLLVFLLSVPLWVLRAIDGRDSSARPSATTDGTPDL